MQKQREMNQELIRKRFVEIFEEYSKSKSAKAVTTMKEVVAEYDDVVEMLDETLNCSVGIMDAIAKKELKEEEEKTVVNEILKELKEKSYLIV